MDLDIAPCLHVITHIDLDMAPCPHIIIHMDMDMTPCLSICHFKIYYPLLVAKDMDITCPQDMDISMSAYYN